VLEPETFKVRPSTLPVVILREVLHAHIPTLAQDSTVRDAVDKMNLYQFPALVIVGAEREPLAVVTEGDLSRAVANRDSLTEMSSEPVLIHASKDPTCAEADLEIGEAFHRMLSSGLKLLPVVDEGRLIGVVLRVDLMQALLCDAQIEDV
jgi:CBS domain-containing protein